MKELQRSQERYEKGGTLIVVLILLTALLGGVGVLIYVQMTNTKAVGLVRQSRASLYCAESGLAVARDLIMNNQADWPLLLDGNPANDPAWYPVVGDIGDGGPPDFIVTVQDNDDEMPPAANDRTVDADQRVFIMSNCTSFPEAPSQILELLTTSTISGYRYRAQSGGGAANTGNLN